LTSREVRIRGASLLSGLTPCAFADRLQEGDIPSIPGAGTAP